MKLMNTVHYIYRMRYFWLYLARCDLIARYRRSKLGMLWIVMSPVLMTVIRSVVLGSVFKMSIIEYAPYILIGMVAWELFTSSLVTGGGTFLGAYPYIRQFNHPVIIYTLKSAVVYTANFLIASVGIIIWTLFLSPANVLLGLFTLPLTTVLFFFLSWALVTIAAFINTKYRDYPQMMSLLMQALWYVSPVYFQESMFEANQYLLMLFRYNPITHILYLLRKPFLYCQLPVWSDYLFTVGCIVFFGLIAFFLNKKNAKKVIFYL